VLGFLHLPVASSLESTVKAYWDTADEIAFINYIANHKSEAGDGMKFKSAFWNAAAEMMKAHSSTGGPKTAGGCSTKWDRVCVYLIYNESMNDLTCLRLFTSSKNLTMSLLGSKGYQVSAGMTRMALILTSTTPLIYS